MKKCPRRTLTFLLTATFAAAFWIESGNATNYYIDSVAGSESNNGTSPATAWKTLTPTSKANTIVFQPGDQVLFKRGCSWTGFLHLLGNGSSSAPLVVDAYGTGAAPIINAAGAADSGGSSYAVGIWNKQYVTIQNLELTNDAAADATRHGILIAYGTPGVYSGVKILNNNIHHVRGVSARGGMYNNAAIYIFIQDNSGNGTTGALVDSMLIQGNDIHDIKTIGIFQKGPSYFAGHPEFWATNLVIRDNVIDHTGADFIVIAGAQSPLIESNAGYDAGINGAGYGWIAGMWSSYRCADPTFQFNEVARVHNELAPNDGDGQAFDCDLGALGVNLFQYNYTHDNLGGVLIMMSENLAKTVVYRYNLSVNDDRQTNSGSQLPLNPIPGVNSAYVYNNVFYSTLPLGYKLKDKAASWFYNNIFHARSGNYPSQTNFSNNCYFGHAPDVNDPYKIVADPKFVGPLTSPGVDGFTPANVDMFKLQSSSPCINAGKSISAPISNGGIDFWGNPLYAGTYADIGIHEVAGGSTPPPAAVAFFDNPPSTAVVYTGSGWTHSSDALYYNSTKSLSSTVGNSVRCTFTGTNVSLFGRRGPSYGKLNVSIDGGAPVSVDCYWASDTWRTELFQISGLTNQSHTITATVAAKNSFSTGSWIGVDYFQVVPGTPPSNPVVTTVDNPAGAGVVSYSGGWSFTTGDFSFYGGTRALSATVGNYVDFTFSGTGARIYGTLYSSYGKLNVSIDGGTPILVNCFQPGLNYEYTKIFEVNGLSSGTHTLRATVATKDPLSTGNSISIDFFQSLVGGVTATEIIMDNADSSGVTISGAWTSSTFDPGYYGSRLPDGIVVDLEKSNFRSPAGVDLPVFHSQETEVAEIAVQIYRPDGSLETPGSSPPLLYLVEGYMREGNLITTSSSRNTPNYYAITLNTFTGLPKVERP